MPVQSPYRLQIAREVMQYTFTTSCFIDERLVKPWKDYTLEEQEEFILHGAIPCDGGFTPGMWCEDCRFGAVTCEERKELG